MVRVLIFLVVAVSVLGCDTKGRGPRSLEEVVNDQVEAALKKRDDEKVRQDEKDQLSKSDSFSLEERESVNNISVEVSKKVTSKRVRDQSVLASFINPLLYVEKWLLAARSQFVDGALRNKMWSKLGQLWFYGDVEKSLSELRVVLRDLKLVLGLPVDRTIETDSVNADTAQEGQSSNSCSKRENSDNKKEIPLKVVEEVKATAEEEKEAVAKESRTCLAKPGNYSEALILLIDVVNELSEVVVPLSNSKNRFIAAEEEERSSLGTCVFVLYGDIETTLVRLDRVLEKLNKIGSSASDDLIEALNREIEENGGINECTLEEIFGRRFVGLGFKIELKNQSDELVTA
jgi:hypothetical protein